MRLLLDELAAERSGTSRMTLRAGKDQLISKAWEHAGLVATIGG
jgi:hypothetical protein